MSAAGFIPKHLTIHSTRDTASSSTTAVSPEAVLFRRKDAPTRYAEDDIYFANERESQIDLPDSDLLKALHCYASDFYARATPDWGSRDWRSLDGTALIALGILVEEACKDSLGRTGDLVFTEGLEHDDVSLEPAHGRSTGSRTRSVSNVATITARAKRRKLVEGEGRDAVD